MRWKRRRRREMLGMTFQFVGAISVGRVDMTCLLHEYIHVCLYIYTFGWASCCFRSFCLDWLYIGDKWMCLSAGDWNNYANGNIHTALLFKIILPFIIIQIHRF